MEKLVDPYAYRGHMRLLCLRPQKAFGLLRRPKPFEKHGQILRPKVNRPTLLKRLWPAQQAKGFSRNTTENYS